jgi:hypothetical protein
MMMCIYFEASPGNISGNISGNTSGNGHPRLPYRTCCPIAAAILIDTHKVAVRLDGTVPVDITHKTIAQGDVSFCSHEEHTSIPGWLSYCCYIMLNYVGF